MTVIILKSCTGRNSQTIHLTFEFFMSLFRERCDYWLFHGTFQKTTYHITESVHTQCVCVQTQISFKVVLLDFGEVSFPNRTAVNNKFSEEWKSTSSSWSFLTEGIHLRLNCNAFHECVWTRSIHHSNVFVLVHNKLQRRGDIKPRQLSLFC